MSSLAFSDVYLSLVLFQNIPSILFSKRHFPSSVFISTGYKLPSSQMVMLYITFHKFLQPACLYASL